MSSVAENSHCGESGDIIVGDALDVLDTLPDDHFHAIVTDPPYAISFMDEEWDQFRRKRNENDAERDSVGGRLSSSAPASGAEGDNYEYHKWSMLWAEKAKRVLKPGGHVIAFSGNRTHHRLMCALEDVGYEIRDTITWHYGEGMPKGASLSTWLDGEDANEWGDWRGTLKPATEFAILARAPLGESSATRNQVEHGVGNLNVEACRIGSGEGGSREGEETSEERYSGEGSTNFAAQPGPRGGDEDGRYPANLVLDPVMASVMDLQSGEVGGPQSKSANGQYSQGNTMYFKGGRDAANSYSDSGGASRFFYCSKASKGERTHGDEVENDHPTVKPVDLMEWLVKLVTAEGQRILDPFAGSGTTLLAAEKTNRGHTGVEQNEDYVQIAQKRLSEVQ